MKLFALLFFLSPVFADDQVFVVINGVSWHSEMPGYQFNDFNPGVGTEWDHLFSSKVTSRISVGHYKNSISLPSNYFTVGLALSQYWTNDLCSTTGLDVGVVDGYVDSPLWVAYPVLGVHWHRVGFNILLIPPVDSPWTLGFQFKWQLR